MADLELNEKHQQLKAVLKDNYEVFISKMQKWFNSKEDHMMIRKEELYSDIKSLFTPETDHVFTEFFLAFIAKVCRSSGSSESESEQVMPSTSEGTSKKKIQKRKSRLSTKRPKFNPVEDVKYIPLTEAINSPENFMPYFCESNGALPNASEIRGRLLLESWAAGLESVEDSVMGLLISSTKIYLKNILMAVMARRHAFKTRDHRFRYAVGCSPRNAYIKNRFKRNSLFSSRNPVTVPKTSLDLAECNAAMEIACDNTPSRIHPPLSAIDLLDTLQAHRCLLASHSIHALNVERTISALRHPTTEELNQESIADQERKLKISLTNEITFPKNIAI